MQQPTPVVRTNREWLVLLWHDQQAIHAKLDRLQQDVEALKTTQTQARTLAALAFPAALAALAAWFKSLFHG